MNQLIKLFFVFTLSFILFNSGAQAQDDLLNMLDSGPEKSDKVSATFKTSRIVNAHSIETVKRKALDFRVTHHFGDIAGSDGGGHEFFGLDNAKDIRIAFEYGITDRLTIGIGRSKINEMIDGYLKFRLLQQTTDNKTPVSATLFTNAAIIAVKKSDIYNNFNHRLSYTYQAIIARKFGSKFSLQLMPTMVHRNYVPFKSDESDLYSIGAGARLKLTKRFAILADYFYTFSDFRKNNNVISYSAPLGVGIEIETGGHVFHMFFTNNAGIIENNFIPNTTDSWSKGKFKFGFNISRTFGTGKSNR